MNLAPGRLAQYRKTLASLVGIGLTYASLRWGASNDIVSLAIGIAAVLGVYAVPNADPNPDLSASKADLRGQLKGRAVFLPESPPQALQTPEPASEPTLPAGPQPPVSI